MDSRLEIMKEFLDQVHGLVVVDRESNIVYIEANYAKELGYDAKELIGIPVKQVIPDKELKFAMILQFLKSPFLSHA